MPEVFEPELGQYAFSNSPWQQIPLDVDAECSLNALGELLVAIGLCANAPTANTGDRFECDTFKMRAYCWCDGNNAGHEKGCPPNFEWRDWVVAWYKHVGRGASQNRKLSKQELAIMARECMNAMLES